MMYEPCGPDVVDLEAWADGGWRQLASLDGRHLSTEIAGGFTGRLVAVQAVAGRARVTQFAYRPTQS